MGSFSGCAGYRSVSYAHKFEASFFCVTHQSIELIVISYGKIHCSNLLSNPTSTNSCSRINNASHIQM